MVRTRWQPPHQQLSSSSALDIQLLFGCLLSTPHARYRYPAPPHIYFLRNKPTTAHTPMHHANCLCTYIYPRDSAGNKCPVTHGRRPGPRGVCVTRTVDYNYIQERVIAQNAQAMPTKLHAAMVSRFEEEDILDHVCTRTVWSSNVIRVPIRGGGAG
jgi:hypothetical protein